MKRLLFSLLSITFLATTANAQWTSLATDPAGDGTASGGLDGTKLEYKYDPDTDSVWFRVTVSQFRTSGYGLNMILDVNGAGTQDTWWGNQNSSFKYNRLITAWITSGTSGTVGVCDPSGAATNNFTSIAGASKVQITTDAANKTYTIGMKRTDIYNGSSLDARVIAATGSNASWGDDVPNTGSGMINLIPTPSSVKGISEPNTFRIYPNPTSGTVTIENNTNEPVQVKIYNVTGTIVHTSTTTNKKVKVELGHLQSGNYFIKLISKGTVSSQIITLL